MEAETSLATRAFRGLAQFLLALALITFAAAGTLVYWQGWLFLAVFGAGSALATYDIFKRDPALLEGRLKAGPGAEQRLVQKLIQAGATIAFLAAVCIPALDYRFGWSQVPLLLVLAGFALLMAGFAGIYWVFRVNSFAVATITKADHHHVVSTGPYAIIRHPMYSAALLMFVGIPLGLGSYWGLLVLPFLVVLLAVRLLDEERFLAENLDGYRDYRNHIRYRLIPLIW